jgi:hypothetical protein
MGTEVASGYAPAERDPTMMRAALFLLSSGCAWVGPATERARLDPDGDGVLWPSDCDDNDASIGISSEWFPDLDADGVGAGVSETACAAPEGFVALDGDCDDAVPESYPGAPELCDGLDNNCDGAVDEGLEELTWYADADGDGAGDPETVVMACAEPEGAVETALDCDDTDEDVSPEHAEVWYDGVDNDCDEATVDGDADGDGVDAIEAGGDDCDDHDATALPTAPTDDCDGVDNDCDGFIDEDVLGLSASCPVQDCLTLFTNVPDMTGGIYFLAPVGGGEVYETYCAPSIGDGGWTLVLVSSDDGQATFTWANRALWDTDPTPVGDVRATDHDFKSPAYHDVAFHDLLFIHRPSGQWAVYNDVGDGSVDLGTFIGEIGESACWLTDPEDASTVFGYPMSMGSLVVSGALCSTDLYFNSRDLDSYNCVYAGHDAHGPNWSTEDPGGGDCPLDDPGRYGSLGPSAEVDEETDGRGFGWALGLNTAAPGAAQNMMEVFVR